LLEQHPGHKLYDIVDVIVEVAKERGASPA
jgi:hypothetical protein